MIKPKKNTARFYVPGVDDLRADVAASVSALASAASLSRDTVKKVLDESPTQKVSCEKVLAGLRKLGCEAATIDRIEEVDLS